MEQKVVAILPKEELAKEMEIRQKRIDALTKLGEKRIADLHREIRSVKSNHQIPKEAKEDIIIKDKALIEEAKKVALTNKEELKRERKEFYQLVSSQYGAMLKEKSASNKKEKEYICNIAVCKAQDDEDVQFIDKNLSEPYAIKKKKKRFDIE